MLEVTPNATELADLIPQFMQKSVGKMAKAFLYPGDLGKIMLQEPNGAGLLREYNGAYVHRKNFLTVPGYALAGTGLPKAKKRKGAAMEWRPTTDYMNVEMGRLAAIIGKHPGGNIPGVPDQLALDVQLTADVLRDWTSTSLMLSSAGILAKIYNIEAIAEYGDDAVPASKLYCDPVFCLSKHSRDAVKYIRETMPLDVVTMNFESRADAEVVSANTDGYGYEVQEVYASATEHASYVIVTPQLEEGCEAGMYLALNKMLNHAVEGIFDMLGDGTVTAAGIPLGDVDYGDLTEGTGSDRSATKNKIFHGACANLNPDLVGSDPDAEVTLGTKFLIDCWHWARQHSRRQTEWDAILCTANTWTTYAMAGDARASLFNSTPVKNVDLGITAPTWTSPSGKALPIVSVDDMPEATLAFVDKGTILTAKIDEGWDTGNEFSYFTRMMKWTGQDILRAIWSRYWFVANYNPECLFTIHNVNLTPS